LKKLFMMALFGILPCFALIFSFISLQINHQRLDESFEERLFHLVKKCVEYNDSAERREILKLLDRVHREKWVLAKGDDDLRIKFVNLQGCIEHILAREQALGEVVDLIGMIHTPQPATPLCTRPNNLDEELLNRSIRHDLEKQLTVRSRAQIVREYLNKGALLYVVYPKGGFEKRTPQQQVVYLEELERYPNQLVDWVLSTPSLHPEMSGATYFCKNSEGKTYVFSIMARQANDPQEDSEWGLWLGELEHPEIRKRVDTLFAYFRMYGGPTWQNFKLD